MGSHHFMQVGRAGATLNIEVRQAPGVSCVCDRWWPLGCPMECSSSPGLHPHPHPLSTWWQIKFATNITTKQHDCTKFYFQAAVEAHLPAEGRLKVTLDRCDPPGALTKPSAMPR